MRDIIRSMSNRENTFQKRCLLQTEWNVSRRNAIDKSQTGLIGWHE